MPRLFGLLCLVAIGLLAGPASAKEKAPGPEAVEFFEKKVRPILVEQCHSCHSRAAKKKRGSLYLDSRADLLKGGDTSPAVVPGDAEKSLLIRAVSYKEMLRMPPRS